MKILALEFSSELRSVAALNMSANATGIAEEMGGRNTFSLIERALCAAKMEREEIDLLAIGLGPGSYTGIRGALATAQGWQIARETKTLGISSVDVLAAQARDDGIHGPVNIVIDAQREEFYLARFQIGPSEIRMDEPLRLASKSEVAVLENRGALIGPDIQRWFKFGRNIFPRALGLARLAALRNGSAPAEKLEPIYLREPNFKKAPPRRILS